MAKANLAACLWYDGQAEEAANFYVAIFRAGGRQAAITDELRHGEAGPGPVGSILTVGFELEGRPFIALNGGPNFKFNHSVSFMVMCTTQTEIEYFWNKLQEGGGAPSECGWLIDRFGLSWQVTPVQLLDYLKSSDTAASQRTMRSMMTMAKLDIAELKKAFEG